jgi:hypothetical protein
MSGDDTTTTASTEETFTRAQVRNMIAAEVRKVREQFADYDDLKRQAAEADKSKSAIERIEAKLDETTKRAEKAEREALVREVADELGVSMRIARKFEGKTRDELLADGRETLTDMGIEPDKSKRKSTASTKSTKDETDGDDGDTDEGGTDRQDDEGTEQQQTTEAAPVRRRRPVETLRSGSPAARSGGAPDLETMDPLELVKNVRRG